MDGGYIGKGSGGEEDSSYIFWVMYGKLKNKADRLASLNNAIQKTPALQSAPLPDFDNLKDTIVLCDQFLAGKINIDLFNKAQEGAARNWQCGNDYSKIFGKDKGRNIREFIAVLGFPAFLLTIMAQRINHATGLVLMPLAQPDDQLKKFIINGCEGLERKGDGWFRRFRRNLRDLIP